MIDMKVMKAMAVSCGLVLLGATNASAQISIDHTEIPQMVGDSFWYKYNEDISDVDVGQTGGPHTWVFDTALYLGWVDDRSIVDKGTTPFAGAFPAANQCYYENAHDSAELYFYHGLTSTEYRMYGEGWVGAETSYARIYNPSCLSMAFPCNYGTAWNSRFGWADTIQDTIWVVTDNMGRYVIDAWGTAEVPAGTFPCLRANLVQRYVLALFRNGMPLVAETSWTRMYHWFAEGVGCVATAKSLRNDTTPDFDSSNCYTVLVKEQTGGIEERLEPIGNRQEPMASIVRGVLELRRIGDSPSRARYSPQFALMDASGRKVMELVAGENDIRHVSPGVYFVVGKNRSVSRRVIVAR